MYLNTRRFSATLIKKKISYDRADHQTIGPIIFKFVKRSIIKTIKHQTYSSQDISPFPNMFINFRSRHIENTFENITKFTFYSYILVD